MVGGGGSSDSSCNGTQVGGTGVATTFGVSLINAFGGGGGVCGDVVNGGVGGSYAMSPAAIGTAILGTSGHGNSLSNPAATGLIYTQSGAGGNSPYFAGGAPSIVAGNSGLDGNANTGGGGSGAGFIGTGVVTRSGSGGGSGGFIEAIVTSPSSTYSYTVGNGGAGGINGTGGFVGGSGGSGYIEVTEYYQ